MGMFDDVFVNAKSAANAVGKKASQLVDLSKLRLSAADLNGEISRKFQELGRTVYSAHQEGTQPSEDVKADCAEISDLMEQLDAVNAQLAAAHAKIVCGFCGQENPQEAVFCNKCGHVLHVAKTENTEEQCCCGENDADKNCCCNSSDEDCCSDKKDGE